MVYLTATVNVTNAGTGSGGLNLTLPFTNNSTYNGTVSGREQVNTGATLQGIIGTGSTTAYIVFYNNATTIVTGNNLIISGFYQRA
jgi:hypothetical protein